MEVGVLIKLDEYQFKRDFVILLVTYKSLIKVYKVFNYPNVVLGFKIMFISRMMDFRGH